MTQIFGDFIESRNEPEYLIIGFSPSSLPLQQRWRNSGLSADFLGDYVSTFFPAEDTASADRQIEIKDGISYVANELLENAMKFNYEASKHSISIALYLRHDEVRFYVANTVDPETISDFQSFINKLLSEDPYELYINQLELNIENEIEGNSGLGLLTMINDYEADLAWKFTHREQKPEKLMVTTMVRLRI